MHSTESETITNSGPPPQSLVDASHPGRDFPAVCICILALIVLFAFYYGGDQHIAVLILIIISVVLTALITIGTIVDYREKHPRTHPSRRDQSSESKRMVYSTGSEMTTCVTCGKNVFPLICEICGLNFCVACSKEHSNEAHQDTY